MANESDNGLTRKGKNTDRELPECPKVYHLSESPGHILFFPKCGRSEDPALLVLRKGLGRFLVGSKRKIQSQSTLIFSLFLSFPGIREKLFPFRALLKVCCRRCYRREKCWA